MLRRTLAKSFGYEAMGQNMILIWRMYRDRVGEVRANIENLHWSVTQDMLQSYLDLHVKSREVRLDKDYVSRNGHKDPERLAGKSIGTASVTFLPGQEEALARFFKTRHVLNGKELLLRPVVDDAPYNFYLPNTHEDDAKNMDPSTVRKMATQMIDMSQLINGKFKKTHIVELQQLSDRLKRQRNKEEPAEPLNPDKPWFYGMGDDKWEDISDKGEGLPSYKLKHRKPKSPQDKRTSTTRAQQVIQEAEYEVLTEKGWETDKMPKKMFKNVDIGVPNDRGNLRS